MEIDNKNEHIDTSNIFDDFTDDEKLKEEIKEIVKNQQRDIFYYIQKLKIILQYSIIFMLIVSFFSYGYIFIQNSEKYNNSNLIDPICFIILGDIVNSNNYCSSVASLFKQYSNELTALKNSQLSSINSIFESVYKIENFKESKELVFLKNKSDSKLDIIGIMVDFDKLLSDFEPTEKEKISCHNMEIFSDNKIKVTCDAYATGFEKTIKGFDGTNNTLVGGTSISYASSFINFIKTQQDVFYLTNEQKVFNSTPLLLESKGFTDKTSFNLELQYNSEKIIF